MIGKWLFIGDSITVGMLDGLISSLRDSNISSYVTGRTGWSATRWLDSGEAERLITEQKPTVVVFLLGTNEEVTIDKYIQSATTLTNNALRHCQHVYWVGSFISEERNAAIHNLYPNNTISGVEISEGIAHTPDGVHFRIVDYPKIASRIVERLINMYNTQVLPSNIKKAMVVSFCVLCGIIFGAIALGSPTFEKHSVRRKP